MIVGLETKHAGDNALFKTIFCPVVESPYFFPLKMAVAEPAHRVTFKTIGGILLAAFFAASVGFYVHTTNARDIPGYIYDVRLLSACLCLSSLSLRRRQEKKFR